jgi:hypothetical protein
MGLIFPRTLVNRGSQPARREPLMSVYRLSWLHRGVPAALLTGGGLIAA